MAELPEFVEKLPLALNKELTYTELCEILSLTKKYGNSKRKQIKEIGLYCDLQEFVPEGKIYCKYLITEIYDKAILPIHTNNKYQAPIEALIFKILQANNYQTLYYTNSQLLSCLNMVNENYIFIKSPKNRRLLSTKSESHDLLVMTNLYNGASKSGEILMKWADRALRKMDERGFILYRHGFCLVLNPKDTNTKVTYNVPLDSHIEKLVLQCYKEAYQSLGLKFDANNRWVPLQLKAKFYSAFDDAICNNSILEQMFDSQGFNLVGGYRANVITSNNKAIDQALSEYNVSIINTEAQRKIHDTKQLDPILEAEERDMLIKEIIARPPSVRYYDIINSPRE